MDKKNILPQQGKPVFRTTTGKLPSYLAELSEEALGGNGLEASHCATICAFDGAEASHCATICAFDGAEASHCATICAFDGDEA
ncbi:Microcyclamide protein [Microcystis aeruginosa PCC 9806]|uniref:Microcyclamide/patellamide family RiPP n=3 Tax=Microcystis TaxID=1125 RepID=A0A552LCS4_9CHRO|nr:microcyclamide/patellamide family RiPP [Microcystis aeruginosa]ELP56843.1 patellamide domain protein [Microcystis aeruginosa TAIHU98]ROI11035.1 microcyclamide/patellamide family RiPP [Microcystis aeruginosa FACHB-524]TRV18014.1 MAG: microcyclamide/patellamide family RiPP [Microcystis flos-aquae Mf_WU_F_19750830_S460]CCI15908.1 Microcyclamide protein [Microcystis aeruginosa PCC 9806]